jgi:hypothetical protein
VFAYLFHGRRNANTVNQRFFAPKLGITEGTHFSNRMKGAGDDDDVARALKFEG